MFLRCVTSKGWSFLAGDLWSEIIKSEEEGGDSFGDVPKIEAVYQRRKKPEKLSEAADL